MNDEWTTINEVLSGLSSAAPDAARSAHVRERCHKELTRPPLRRTVESAVVGGFCAVYFAGVALMALRTHGLL